MIRLSSKFLCLLKQSACELHSSSIYLTFYKYFTGKSVNTIPTNISTLDTNGQILYLIFMNDLDANFLRQLVNEFQFKTLPLKTEQIISPKK